MLGLVENKWNDWNNLGLFPGVEEAEASYNQRVEFCLNLRQYLQKNIESLPFEEHVEIDIENQNFLEEVFPLTKVLYGIEPTWVPLFFSNYQLAPWHGGCAWIFQLDEQLPTAAFLQLRAHFRTSKTYLGLYQRNELIAHELAHAGRMVYQEPNFEEIFAYQSSSSPLRKWLGPIVQSSKESLIFILLIGLMVMADFALAVWWVMFIPLGVIMLALVRLARLHLSYRQCLKRLEEIYDPQTARHLLYRLTDSEIQQFAQLSTTKVCMMMDAAKQTSFRWRFLSKIYPFSCLV
jgi:hypothetical protein